MKTKHIIIATSAAIIAGSIFYYMTRRSRQNVTVKPALVAKTGKEKIRQVMHLAKESHS